MAKIINRKLKLTFQFNFLDRVYKDNYNYDDFFYNAMIMLRNKFPFLPNELLVARAKDEWNKKWKKIASKTKPSIVRSGRIKKPLIFESESSHKIRSTPRKRKLFDNKDLVADEQSMSVEKSSLVDPEIIDNLGESSSLLEDFFIPQPSPEIVDEQSKTKCSISRAYLPINFDGDDDNRLTTTIEEIPQKMSISMNNIPLYLNDE